MAINLKKNQIKKDAFILIGLGWDTNAFDSGYDFDLDIVALLLDEQGKVISDDDFIFYNNLKSKGEAVVHRGDNLTGDDDGDDELIVVNTAKIYEPIKKIIIYTCIHSATDRKHNFGQAFNSYVRVARTMDKDDTIGQDLFRYDLAEDYSLNTSLLVCEIVKQIDWTVNLLGVGLNEELPLIGSKYGVSNNVNYSKGKLNQEGRKNLQIKETIADTSADKEQMDEDGDIKDSCKIREKIENHKPDKKEGMSVSKVLIGMMLVSSILGGGYFALSDEKNSSDIDIPNLPVVNKGLDNKTLEKKNSFVNDAKAQEEHSITELSLGGVDVDSTLDSVQNWMGESLNVNKDNNGAVRLKYEDVDVSILDGVVIEIISNTGKVYTKRGIHQGSSEQDVIQSYGEKPYAKSSYEGSTLYEYKFKSINGRMGLLRFAIKNGTVEYISGRIIEIESNKNNVDVNNADDEGDVEAATETFIGYHVNITKKNYDVAMNCLSSKKRSTFKNINQFKEGYKATISSQVKINSAKLMGDKVVIYYELEARDYTGSKKVKKCHFQGEVKMIKEGKDWKMDEIENKKIDEYME